MLGLNVGWEGLAERRGDSADPNSCCSLHSKSECRDGDSCWLVRPEMCKSSLEEKIGCVASFVRHTAWQQQGHVDHDCGGAWGRVGS